MADTGTVPQFVSVEVFAFTARFQVCPFAGPLKTRAIVAEPVAPTSGSDDVKVMVLGVAVNVVMTGGARQVNGSAAITVGIENSRSVGFMLC